jgi:hypothetical protein
MLDLAITHEPAGAAPLSRVLPMGPATETAMDALTLAWLTGPPEQGGTPGPRH